MFRVMDHGDPYESKDKSLSKAASRMFIPLKVPGQSLLANSNMVGAGGIKRNAWGSSQQLAWAQSDMIHSTSSSSTFLFMYTGQRRATWLRESVDLQKNRSICSCKCSRWNYLQNIDMNAASTFPSSNVI